MAVPMWTFIKRLQNHFKSPDHKGEADTCITALKSGPGDQIISQKFENHIIQSVDALPSTEINIQLSFIYAIFHQFMLVIT